MIIYPAIDIKGGRAVRLEQGHMDRSTDYGDPIEAAKRWAEAGAQYIHIVDLDGAVEGTGMNLDVVKAIVRAVDLPVQLGGGVRELDDIAIRLEEIGVKRVILGTIAISNPDLVRAACVRWPGCVVIGMDVREGMLAVRGWAETSAVTPTEIMPRMRDAGVDTIVYTDIRRDGMLQGPNLDATRDVVENSKMKVIASGGISSLDDLSALQGIGCEGAIVGKALYSGTIDIEKALQL